MKRRVYLQNVLFLIFITILLLFFIQSPSYSATPKIVDKMSSAFENIEKWLIKLATPSAAVAVAVGLFMKKFSFGDEERIRSAKKIIRSSLVSYAILLGLDLILSAIKSLIS